MQINANYSVNGVPYDNKRKQNNIPQFSTEYAVQENENINQYMAEFILPKTRRECLSEEIHLFK